MRVRVASAGTGKTTSLVLRYLEYIGSGTPPRRIAGVTFTRAGADELRLRVGEAIRELLASGTYLDYRLTEGGRPAFEEALLEIDGSTLTTIHGFMIAALRLSAPIMGLDPDFGVLGEWEAAAAFDEEVRSLIYLAQDPGHALHDTLAILGGSTESLLRRLFDRRSLCERFVTDEHPRNRALLALFEPVYRRYESRLGTQMLPPGEVERRALLLARTQRALERVLGRYQVALIDEFQDVNPLQGTFFETLERGGLEVEVVGDPKQSIYGFRHADVEVFRRALRRGELLSPLDRTHRHSRVLARFLNRFTETLAAKGLGFGPDEAPAVEPAGPRVGVRGRVELHWVVGESGIAELRGMEAALLAERLGDLHHRHGHPYTEMAVLARSYAGLQQAELALERADIPYVLLQGRGYYERIEIRDLVHALRVGVEPAGLSLGSWLRSPFGQLPLAEVDMVVRADAPLEVLAARHPEVAARLESIREAVRGPPLAALKTLIRQPFARGRSYVDHLGLRARENVDALLFEVARRPPGNLEILLEWLELRSRQAEAGDVPQSGEGVQLLTVHRAKGLEWPVVAIFDSGRGLPSNTEPLLIHPESGVLTCADTPGYQALRELKRSRDAAESHRLLYVALSRARDVVLVTGSVRGDRPVGWIRAFEEMGLGPGARPYDRAEFVLKTHVLRPADPEAFSPGAKRARTRGRGAAPWIDRSFRHNRHPPVQSPSGLKGEVAHEPLPLSDPDEGERLPGRAAAVGTLVHYAISRDWSAGDPVHLENLRTQGVMFPYGPAEQQDVLDEVRGLLTDYEGLLGDGLPPLSARIEDYSELPMALPMGDVVWQGVIDRLYRTGDGWVLEDYKTDLEPLPERYHVQLAIYLEAVKAVRDVTPQVQLVFLRERQIVRVGEDDLRRAFDEVMRGEMTSRS